MASIKKNQIRNSDHQLTCGTVSDSINILRCPCHDQLSNSISSSVYECFVIVCLSTFFSFDFQTSQHQLCDFQLDEALYLYDDDNYVNLLRNVETQRRSAAED